MIPARGAGGRETNTIMAIMISTDSNLTSPIFAKNLFAKNLKKFI